MLIEYAMLYHAIFAMPRYAMQCYIIPSYAMHSEHKGNDSGDASLT
jgi:hypothetical protein